MYIIKNAIRNVTRSKGRNVLIGCIALVIGLAACLALSIKEAAVKERDKGLDDITITASIGVDRQAMMEQMQQNGLQDTTEQRSSMKEHMAGAERLSLTELQKYAKAASVKDFYYTGSLSMNGFSIEAVEMSSSSTSASTEGMEERPGGMMSGKEFGNNGDFTFTSYSSYDAMNDFTSGSKTVIEGAMFTEGSDALECVIHQELATLNKIEQGDEIMFVNPDNSDDVIKLKVTGIYSSAEAEQSDAPMDMSMLDPANQIYISYESMQAMITSSVANAVNTENDTQLKTVTRGTYTFTSIENYEAFEDEARSLGLSDMYIVSSNDVSAFERSLQPLENLSNYATYFLMVILTIGGTILVVLNIYHIRERKYEIGVLAAIGMNKKKIALQFIFEIFMITFIAILMGTGVGAVISVPFTNTLLANQSTTSDNIANFGALQGRGDRGEDRGMDMPGGIDYIQEVSSTTNMKVIAELAGIGILLTILTGGIAVLTTLRYEPLKILSNRD